VDSLARLTAALAHHEVPIVVDQLEVALAATGLTAAADLPIH